MAAEEPAGCPHCQEQETALGALGLEVEFGRMAPVGSTCDFEDIGAGEAPGQLAWVPCGQPAIIARPAVVICYEHACDYHAEKHRKDDCYDIHALPSGISLRCHMCELEAWWVHRQPGEKPSAEYLTLLDGTASWAVLTSRGGEVRCEPHCVDHEAFPLPEEDPGPSQEQVGAEP